MPDPIATVFPAVAGFHSSAAASANQVVRPMAADLPPKIDLSEILEDVADDSVSAPEKQVDGLLDVVDRAQEHGIALRIVVLPKDPSRDSQLRDLATEVGADEGGTVLVLSPSWVGSFSNSISRVQLESGQDRTYTDSSVDAANNFLDELLDPGPPWALMTLALILVVVVTAGLSLFAKIRRSPSTGKGATGNDTDTSPVIEERSEQAAEQARPTDTEQ